MQFCCTNSVSITDKYKYTIMKNKLFACFLAFVCVLPLASCSKDDGDVEPMEWADYTYDTVKVPGVGKAISVPKDGGTYTFRCKNCTGFWIDEVTEQVGDKYVRTVPIYTQTMEVSGGYTQAMVDANSLTVVFAPNETLAERSIVVNVGDNCWGSRFLFVQKP